MSNEILVAALTGWDNAPSSDFFTNSDVHFEGNNDAWRLIDKSSCRWVRYHIGPGYLRQSRRWNMEEPDVVFNLISDIDLNPKTLRIADRITRPVADRLINRPADIGGTRRHDIATMLQDVPDLIVPRVLHVPHPTFGRLQARISAENFSFPAIVRRPGTHSGVVLGVYDKPEDLRPVLQGREEELILTEFKDYRSADGLYRKMRFFVIGNAVIFRHLLFSPSWNVHARDRLGIMAERPDLLREERHLMDSDAADILEPARRGLEELKRRIKLDYFGMDCGLAPDGRLLIFEINATMNFFPFLDDPRFDYLRAAYGQAVSAMNQLLYSRARQPALQAT